ncbi:hypothetical protein F6X40_17095 [Paraburkholderia sp. UCT31]|uniref:hypothetical protein n=1 Tax=Paraburkholderia sp. UCT31 TaxID=2615209 RepID=UPI0016559087|nr:hypothetical protein [Paraburkholderia sp. UCT31]MBC8738492.1 hypothetical protein [Paraburkholderia sp. UCT31]
MDINFIKAKATAAVEFLAGQGVEVQHTAILEMLSRLEGFRNWSTFREQLAVTSAVSNPPTVQQALTMCYRWMASAPIEELEAVESALGENAPMAMAAEALKAAGTKAVEADSKARSASTEWSLVMGAMTDSQYVARRGCRCPACGSNSVVSRGRLEGEGGGAGQNVECRECGASWTDLYALTGYSDLEGGFDHEGIESVVEDVKGRAEEYGFSIDSESQAREVVDESCDLLANLSEAERKIAVMQLTSELRK